MPRQDFLIGLSAEVAFLQDLMAALCQCAVEPDSDAQACQEDEGSGGRQVESVLVGRAYQPRHYVDHGHRPVSSDQERSASQGSKEPVVHLVQLPFAACLKCCPCVLGDLHASALRVV